MKYPYTTNPFLVLEFLQDEGIPYHILHKGGLGSSFGGDFRIVTIDNMRFSMLANSFGKTNCLPFWTSKDGKVLENLLFSNFEPASKEELISFLGNNSF